MSELINEIAGYYSRKLGEHGATPRGVDWNGLGGQTLRFAQLTQLIEADQPYSLNDLGCGYGALFQELQQSEVYVDYCGIDVSSCMIQAAKARTCGIPNVNFVIADTPDRIADYGVASGIFNVRQTRTNDEWECHMLEVINALNLTSRKGFAFNCLCPCSDPDFEKSHLYYTDPQWLVDVCRDRYSKDVTLLTDYGLFEFTILVRKRL